MTRRKVLLLAASLVLFGCSPGQERPALPIELRGTWITEQASYEDKFLVLSAASVTIGTGETTAHEFPLRKFSTSREKEGLLYAVTYVNTTEDVEDTLFFYYAPSAGGTITFKNQPRLVWKKK